MHDATLCLLVRGNPPREVLLGLKRVGFGAGKYTGFGGKVEAGETVAAAAIRELKEETGVKASVKHLRPVARLAFQFPANPAWSQRVHVFLVTRWKGDPVASEEMTPVWFAINNLPYQHMWQDGPYWLPRVLSGQRLRACFTFQADNETVAKVEIKPWAEKQV